jgi:hypothetical protein
VKTLRWYDNLKSLDLYNCIVVFFLIEPIEGSKVKTQKIGEIIQKDDLLAPEVVKQS